MGKGFGIAALIVALIAFGVPIYGIVVSWFALALATIAALAGDRVFPIVTPIVVALNTVFFSPTTLALFFDENQQGSDSYLTVTIILFIAPIAAMILNATRRIAQGRSPEN